MAPRMTDPPCWMVSDTKQQNSWTAVDPVLVAINTLHATLWTNEPFCEISVGCGFSASKGVSTTGRRSIGMVPDVACTLPANGTDDNVVCICERTV